MAPSPIPFPVRAKADARVTNEKNTRTALVKTKKAPARMPTPSKKRKFSETNDDDNDGDSVAPKKAKGTPKPSKGKRKANANPLRALPMARNYEQCAPHDKMLIDMRDSGKSWADIRKKWAEVTGDNTADSTLPNRYSRLKSNFVVIKEEDNPVLIEAKQEVEAGFEREKWSLIAKAMEEKGADSYRPDSLARQYKKLMQFAEELQADDKGTKMTGASGHAADEEDASGVEEE